MIWVENGRPHNGHVANIRRATRASYHRELRLVARDEDNLRKLRMAEMLCSNDNRDLWREVKKIKSLHRLSTCVIDGNTNNEDIANCLKDKYCKLFNSVPSDKDDLNTIKVKLHTLANMESTLCITVQHVVDAVKSLNKGKSDGSKGLNSNHIIYGNNRLYVLISLLL